MDRTKLRDAWFPPDADATPPHAARHRTAAVLREVTDLLVGADPAATTDEQLAAAEALATRLRDVLAGWPSKRDEGSLARAALPHGALVERSPISGLANPLAPPLRYAFTGETTRAWAVFSDAYEGPPGGVHGGYVAGALDEVLGVAQIASGTAGYTGTLEIRYHQVTPLGERIDYEAKVAERNGRKLTIHAESRAGDRLLAEGRGLFIAANPRPARRSTE